MASYKYASVLHTSDSAEFDRVHSPGTLSPYAGIFRCVNCGHEIGIAEGKELPPQNHSQHPPSKPILWRLAVFAMHNRG